MSQAAKWPALKKWTRQYLREAFQGHKVVVGNYPMAFDDYLAYADSAIDDMPLYLFDCKFAAKAPRLVADYSVRPALQPPIFSVTLWRRSELGTDDWRFVRSEHFWDAL